MATGGTSTNLRASLCFCLSLFLLSIALYFSYLCQYPYQRAVQSLAFPYQLDAEEGFLLGQSLRIVSGTGMYLPINEPPYVVDNYPPLYPALWSVAACWAGPSLAPGRWIALAGSALTVLGIFAIIFGIGRRCFGKSICRWQAGWQPFLLAWLCPLLFVTSAAHLRWMAYARVDLLAVGLSISGLALMAIWGWQKSWARGTAVILFALAFLTKQTSIMAPAACLIWLLLYDRRTGFRFLLELAIALLIPTIILVLVTKGQYWLHTVTYNENIMHWSELRGWAQQQRSLYAPLLVALAILVAWGFWQLWPRKERAGYTPDRVGLDRDEGETFGDAPLPPVFSLIFVYFIFSVLSLLSLAKAGAAENYLLEPTVSAVIFLGVSLSALLAKPAFDSDDGLSGHGTIHITISIIITVLLLWHAGRFYLRDIERVLFHTAPSPNVSALFQGDRVVREIRQRPGPVLSEDPIYILKAGEPILFQHFIMTQLAAEGKWDPAPVIQMAERAEFSLIAAHQDLFNENQFFNRYPPALRAAINKNYTLFDRLDRGPLQPIFLYIPQDETDK